MQARAYIESTKLKKLEDISWIKDVDKCSGTTLPSYVTFYYYDSLNTAKLIFFTYLFLNILILVFTILYFGKVFSWIEQPQHKKLKELLKASAIVLTFINLGTFVYDLIIHTATIIAYTHNGILPIENPKSRHLTDFDYGIYLILKIVLVFLILIFDITVSCFNTCKHRPGCSSAVYASALCQITWFMHRLATDIIIFVIAFTVAPAQALGMVTLLLSTVGCAVFFVSKCQAGCSCRNCTCNRKTFPTICCTILIAICTIGLICTVTLLFISLVDNGLQSAGVGGFILSLIPPVVVFVIGLGINREFATNFYYNVLTSTGMTRSATLSEEDAPADEDVNIQTNKYTQLVQTSVAIDMEGHENFEEEPYRPAQKIGL